MGLAQAEQFFSPKELAEYLRVPVQTIYRWSYVGDGPRSLKVGRHLRYRYADVEAWLENRAKGGTAA